MIESFQNTAVVDPFCIYIVGVSPVARKGCAAGTMTCSPYTRVCVIPFTVMTSFLKAIFMLYMLKEKDWL